GQRVFALPRAFPSTLAFSPDSRHLLTADKNGIARVFDVESGQEIVPALPHGGPILAGAAFSPSGAQVLTASDREIRLWDLTVGEPVASAVDKPADRITYSPDGKSLV